MNKISEYTKEILKDEIDATWNQKKAILELNLGNNRKQTIAISKSDNYYIFKSTIAHLSELKKLGHDKNDIIKYLWEINRDIDFINFTIDENNNIIGRLEFMAKCLDPEEFVHSIKQLSMECDKYEFALTGDDKY